MQLSHHFLEIHLQVLSTNCKKIIILVLRIYVMMLYRMVCSILYILHAPITTQYTVHGDWSQNRKLCRPLVALKGKSGKRFEG